jgi:alkane 1-monooxygenase
MAQIAPFVLLVVLPLAYDASGAISCLIPPALFVGFALGEIAVGAELGNATAGLRHSQTSQGATRQGAAIARRAALWLYVPAQLAAMLWATARAGQETELVPFLALAVSIGMTAGVFGMLTAHELIHSRYQAERALGLAMLAGVNYMHFRISHVFGHHRRAGTHCDPATARQGESAFRFILRSIAGQFAEAWCHEQRRANRGWRSIAGNRVHRYVAVELAVVTVTAAAFGRRGVAFVLVQSAVAIVFLELFNYIAHYGLMRRRSADGSTEPFGPAHSWNAAHSIDNWFLLNAGRHAHHHRAPSLAYPQLVATVPAPDLPYGIAGSMLLALVPPLWRRVMDPILDDWQCSRAALPPGYGSL